MAKYYQPNIYIEQGGDVIVIGDDQTPIKKISVGTVSINPASIATVTRVGTTFTITGAAVGDFLEMNPPAGLNDDLIYCGCAITGADTATMYLYNPTGGSIDDSALTWRYKWTDCT